MLLRSTEHGPYCEAGGFHIDPWRPVARAVLAHAFRQLVAADAGEGDISRPYPFFLAYALEGDPSSLGDAAEWQVEWKGAGGTGR